MTASMSTHRTSHEINVLAPADLVYALIADVTQWPRIFPPTVHVEHLWRDGAEERLQLWATANDEVKTWTSRRRLDAGARRIEFRQEVSQPPVAAMGGVWTVEPLSGAECVVRLLHDFRAVDDAPRDAAWIERAVDRNSDAELTALKTTAELGDRHGDLTLTFDNTVRVEGDAREVYRFIYDAANWPVRLPHVARVRLIEDVPGVQLLEMDTRAKDGSKHTTTSVRVCFPDHKIAYKQTVLPTLMTVHTGLWSLTEEADGVAVTSRHTVMIKPSAVLSVLGADRTVADARAFVRDALSTNSLTTLEHAKSYAERRRHSA